MPTPAPATGTDRLLWTETATGRRLLVDLDDARAHELVAAGGDLNPLSRLLWQHALDAHPWDVVVDVGTNYGEMLLGVELPDAAELIGFEPNPAVRALVSRSLAEAGLRVDLRGEAVADEPGQAQLAVDPDWSGLSSLAADQVSPGGELVDVAVTTLDAVLPATGSFAVKVDVEGLEQQVLAGASTSLTRDEPWAVMLEVLHMPAGLPVALASRYPVVMLDATTHRPTRVTADEIEQALISGHVYAQDCLLLSQAALPALLG